MCGGLAKAVVKTAAAVKAVAKLSPSPSPPPPIPPGSPQMPASPSAPPPPNPEPPPYYSATWTTNQMCDASHQYEGFASTTQYGSLASAKDACFAKCFDSVGCRYASLYYNPNDDKAQCVLVGRLGCSRICSLSSQCTINNRQGQDYRGKTSWPVATNSQIVTGRWHMLTMAMPPPPPASPAPDPLSGGGCTLYRSNKKPELNYFSWRSESASKAFDCYTEAQTISECTEESSFGLIAYGTHEPSSVPLNEESKENCMCAIKSNNWWTSSRTLLSLWGSDKDMNIYGCGPQIHWHSEQEVCAGSGLGCGQGGNARTRVIDINGDYSLTEEGVKADCLEKCLEADCTYASLYFSPPRATCDLFDPAVAATEGSGPIYLRYPGSYAPQKRFALTVYG